LKLSIRLWNMSYYEEKVRMEQIKVTALSVKGSSPWNEDIWICNEAGGLYGVIDGATSLVPFVGAEGETGGVLAARTIARSLTQAELQADSRADKLLELLLDANILLRFEMEQNGIMMERKEELWSACAVLVHITDHWIDYAHAGDCMLIAYYQDDTIRVVTHDQLESIDQLTLDQWADGVAAGIMKRSELWAHTMPQIIRGRQLANSPGGYAVLNGDPDLVNYAEYGRISRVGVKDLLLVSDGLYKPRAVADSRTDGAVELAARIRDMGLQTYIDWLIDLEENDPECVKFPRVKKSDDKTAIYIELGKA
jgi:serine/threonine protein phosphatase PrpC